MNPIGKKFISLFLIFSLMMLSANLYAKERRGAKLIVTKKDGQLIEGELITVKPNSLLLLDTEGKDVSVDIADIKVIRIVKKFMDKFGLGAGIGALIGAAVGTLVGYAKGDDPRYPDRFGSLSAGGNALFYGLAIGGIGLWIGAIIGAFVVKDKKIRIEGMSDSEIKEALDKLRKKARIRDYK
jgi:hypothetical protein